MSPYKWFQTAFGFKMLFIYFCSNYKNNTLSEQITENTKIHQGKRGGPRLPPPGVPGDARADDQRGEAETPAARPTHTPLTSRPQSRGAAGKGTHTQRSEGCRLREGTARPGSPGTPASGPRARGHFTQTLGRAAETGGDSCAPLYSPHSLI